MAKQDRAIQTRDSIVTGAAKIFYRVGYAGASISMIAEEAGVTKGALYFHFSAKEDIARAVIDAEHKAVTDAAEQINETTSSPVEIMMLMCADLAQKLVSDPVVRAGIRLTTSGAIFDPPTRAPYDEWLEIFEALSRSAIEAGEFRDSTDPAKLAHFIIPSFTGVQLLSDVLTDMADLMTRVGEMWEMILPAVTAPGQLESLTAVGAKVFSRKLVQSKG